MSRVVTISVMAGTRAVVGLLLVALAAAACDRGGEDAGPTASPSAAASGSAPPVVVGRERPVKITGPQAGLLTQEQVIAAEPNRAGPGVSITEQVVAELRQRTLAMARLSGKITSARCAGGKVTLAPMAGTWCTVVFRGLRVDWNVVIDHDYRVGSGVVHYTVHPRKRILSAKAVYDSAAGYLPGMSDQVRCDKLPEIWLADVRKSTGYFCQYLKPPFNGERRWVDLDVVVRADGQVELDDGA